MPSAASASFERKKQKILQQLNTPEADYSDLSPKGTIDEGIRDLIRDINQREGLVTTSSCAGRVSVFLEGQRKPKPTSTGTMESTDVAIKPAGPGGKGGGGKWLYVSHSPIPETRPQEASETSFLKIFGLSSHRHGRAVATSEATRFVHLKFEPMVGAFGNEYAQVVLAAALQAGFRESGAINLVSQGTEGAMPMLAVRSAGLSLDSIIGFHDDGSDGLTVIQSLVSEQYLQTLVQVVNMRFKDNSQRVERFQGLLLRPALSRNLGPHGNHENWERADIRRQRKKAEGLKLKQELASKTVSEEEEGQEDDCWQ
ncbi:MAG: hypothetical protein M1836_001897 [Candelina mexicana]|nr:MAG: hypothetical protein M1836_001897 [Candelina mexicana]